MTKEPIYIFLHIPKCGGTTFFSHLCDRFQPDERLELYYHQNNELDTRKKVGQYVLSQSAERRAKLKAIFGHEVYYGLHELFPDREVRYFTFLRQPTARSVSHYNFLLTQLAKGILPPYHRPEIVQDGNRFDLSRWFEANQKQHNFICNFLNAHFFGENLFSGWPERRADESDLEKIKLVLDRFYFIGLTEKPADFIFMYRQLGIKIFLPALNISRKYFKIKDHPEKENLITNHNLLDQKLYSYAMVINRRFKKTRKSFWWEVGVTGLARFFKLNFGLNRVYRLSAELKQRSRTYSRLIARIKRTGSNKF